jgi:hypothetical protein
VITVPSAPNTWTASRLGEVSRRRLDQRNAEGDQAGDDDDHGQPVLWRGGRGDGKAGQ